MPGFRVYQAGVRAGCRGARVRVAVTRPRHRAGPVCTELRRLGFVPVIRALVRVEPLHTALPPLLRAVDADEAAGLAPWLVFTSAEAVRALDEARRAQGMAWPRVRVACVGPVTADAAVRAGLDVTLTPSHWDGAAMADALAAQDGITGARLYWPRAEAADPAVKATLTARGATVLDTVAYRTVRDPRGGARLERDLRAGTLGAVLLFSPSAADAFAALDREPGAAVIIGVIGQATAARAKQRGIPVHVEPQTHSIRALAEQLRKHADRGSIETGGK